jgi:S-adenosylmethionine:tRNA-ribosyltransferase-isomerase (queuine synthetase)
MLPEQFEINETSAEIINTAIRNNKKVASVGTTSARALETAANTSSFEENGKTLINKRLLRKNFKIYLSWL